MHYCTRPSATYNSASGRRRHLGIIVRLYYKQRHEIIVLLPNPFDEILNGVAVDDAVLMQNEKFLQTGMK